MISLHFVFFFFSLQYLELACGIPIRRGEFIRKGRQIKTKSKQVFISERVDQASLSAEGWKITIPFEQRLHYRNVSKVRSGPFRTSAGTAKMQTLLVKYTITKIRQQLNAVKFCADIYSIFTDVPLESKELLLMPFQYIKNDQNARAKKFSKRRECYA